jgi:hypothetical protein
MATLPSDPVPWRPVNVYVTREVAFDFKKLTGVTAQVLERLGCPNCHSGRIIHFHQLEDFLFNPKTGQLEDVLPHGGFRG